MLNTKDNQITFELITHSICKEGLCNRPQLLQAVWQATKRTITNNWTQGKDTLLSNLFRAKGVREFNKFSFILEPTEVLLNDCGLKYRVPKFKHRPKMQNLCKFLPSPRSASIKACLLLQTVNISKTINSLPYASFT